MVFYHSSAANAIPILIYKGALTAFFWRNRGLWPRQAVRGHKKEGGVMKMKKFSYALHNTGQLLSAKAPACYSNVKKAGLKRLDAVSVPREVPCPRRRRGQWRLAARTARVRAHQSADWWARTHLPRKRSFFRRTRRRKKARNSARIPGKIKIDANLFRA